MSFNPRDIVAARLSRRRAHSFAAHPCPPLTSGNSTYAALTAVAAANIVLAGYVYLAFAEDAAERTELNEKKAQ